MLIELYHLLVIGIKMSCISGMSSMLKGYILYGWLQFVDKRYIFLQLVLLFLYILPLFLAISLIILGIYWILFRIYV